METLITMVEGLYTLAGPLGLLAYLPQILTLLKDTGGAASTSLLTWFMWTLVLGITTAYASLVNGDVRFLISSASSLTGTVLVFSIASFKRFRSAKTI